MKDFLNSFAEVYCDYTVFLNESFELFREANEQYIKECGIKLKIPQAVIDEMKAVPMSRTDDYILCCQGLERADKAVKSGMAEIAAGSDKTEFSEDYFYSLCKNSETNIIILSNDITLTAELDSICSLAGKQRGFLTVLEIEENGMTHRLR